MKKPIIAATLFTLRDFCADAKDLPKTAARLKKIGYDYAQISGVGAKVTPAELRKIFLDAGIETIGAHISLPQWRENFKGCIDACHGYGCSYAAIPWMDWNTLKDASVADWKKLFREFDTMAKNALKEGIKLQYHNHDFEFNQFGIKGGKGGKTILEMMFETCKVLQGEPDYGWVMRGGMDPVLWAQKMKGRIDQVHLKGWGMLGGNFVMRALGEDRINWPAIVKASLKSGTHTFIVEQDNWPASNDPFKSLAISREYLKGFLG